MNGPYEGLLRGKQYEKPSHWKKEKPINSCIIIINVTKKCVIWFSITNVTNVSFKWQLVACRHKSFGYVLAFFTNDNASIDEKILSFMGHQAILVRIYFLMHWSIEKTSFIILNFSQCQMCFNMELGERSHPNVNNVFLEAESFLSIIYRKT
jgi:hypothetical protein